MCSEGPTDITQETFSRPPCPISFCPRLSPVPVYPSSPFATSPRSCPPCSLRVLSPGRLGSGAVSLASLLPDRSEVQPVEGSRRRWEVGEDTFLGRVLSRAPSPGWQQPHRHLFPGAAWSHGPPHLASLRCPSPGMSAPVSTGSLTHLRTPLCPQCMSALPASGYGPRGHAPDGR